MGQMAFPRRREYVLPRSTYFGGKMRLFLQVDGSLHGQQTASEDEPVNESLNIGSGAPNAEALECDRVASWHFYIWTTLSPLNFIHLGG